VVLVVENDKFDWRGGEESNTSWKKPDSDWGMSFCKSCGSPVPGANDETRTIVPAGFISAGGEKLKVAHHMWVDSIATWGEIGEGLPAF
jgi:hypothetical protein